MIIHEEFSVTTGANDLALVKLGARVALSTFPPACLPEVDQEFAGSEGRVSGETVLAVLDLCRGQGGARTAVASPVMCYAPSM